MLFQESEIILGQGQNHLAVAGGYVVDALGIKRLRTHPLPRGGSDPAQPRLVRQSDHD
jgi:hypothetical protein